MENTTIHGIQKLAVKSKTLNKGSVVWATPVSHKQEYTSH
jgi:hypothetical protein